MLFPTTDFAVFFVIVFTGSWMLRPYATAWRWFLLAASCIFYLDPFNPVASNGERFVTFNPVILLVIVGAGALTWAVSEFGLGPAGDEVSHPARERQMVGAGGGRRGDVELPEPPVRSGDADRPGSGGFPAACIWAPALIVLFVLATSWSLSQHFPDRVDQASRFLFLLLGVAFINQTFAKAVFAALGPTRERTPLSRWLVRFAVIVDLVVLGYFKYSNWFLDTWTGIASKLGITSELHLDVILPIAISFFTFQAISYVLDTGRGELRPLPLLDFTVYLTFFAHVVAGPIVRVKEFAPQLDNRPDPRFVQSAEAFELIFRGLFKKVVVSSFMASQVVDPVFAAPAGFGRTELLFAILGYAVQIYADFSGYTDIAIGVALLLGIRFPQNFDAPYRSLSLQEFWRRWHMTLSRWLRDYLYIPLGGNRVSPGRTYVNLFLTMLLGGLWHGANWTFVVWGAIHGAGMGIERWIKERWIARGPLGVPIAVVRVLQWALTFVIVCVAWVFFRATDFANAWEMLRGLFVDNATPGAISRVTPVLVVVVVLSIASQFVPPSIPRRITEVFSGFPPVFQVACAAVGLVLINVLGPEGIAPFIYFQF